MTDASTSARPRAPVTRPDRRFYSSMSAFGRFGMRWFAPQIMPAPHSHGHVEFNWLTGGELDYVFDGRKVTAPANRLILFWAGVSHQAIGVPDLRAGDVRQCNIYLPLDSFLYLPKLGALTDCIMGGGVIALPPDAVDMATLTRWYRDYRSGNADRTDLLKVEIGLMLRRTTLVGWETMLPPWIDAGGSGTGRASSLRHVTAMVRFIAENIGEPFGVPDVARATGLHPNYVQTLFRRVMHVSIHRFVIRMRLIRARELLFSTDMSVDNIAFASGFTSLSQFYEQFKKAYGMPPYRLKTDYL
jgi:AraC-like DNA-binding protein